MAMAGESMPWCGRRVPFTLLGGYLGAGKTTIVNEVLRRADGRRLVVLVNDVGAVDVDAALIADHDGQTMALTNGCVCCAIADDFAQTLEEVRALERAPDHVLMELSGVGEPARVAPWADTAGFRLDGIVVAADADQIVELADRRFVGATIREQLAAADVVLLTKTDLALDGGAAARAFVAGVASGPIVEVIGGAVDVGLVLGVDRTVRSPTPGTGHDHRGSVHESSIVELGATTFGELEQMIADLPADVVRAKGLVVCCDVAAPVEVHVVGRRRMVRRRPDLDLSSARPALVVVTVSSRPSN